MRTHERVQRLARRAISRVALALVFAAIAATAASAKTVPLKGVQANVNDATGTAQMRGTLVGDWFVESFVPKTTSPTQLTATGKEHFAGCLDANRNGRCDQSDPNGTLDFEFLYWQTTNPQTRKPVRGACLHPVINGTGAFKGAVGELVMIDSYPNGKIHTAYSGTLTYGPTAADRTPQSAVAATTHVC